MSKVKNTVLTLLGIIFVFFFLWYQLNRYGSGYNKKRIELGIPVINENWSRKYSFLRSEINYINPIIGKEKRYHLRKRIQTDWLMNIEKESDYFIIEDKGLVIDAIYEYGNRNWQIRYYDKNLAKTVLTYRQFLDTLKKYNVDIN